MAVPPETHNKAAEFPENHPGDNSASPVLDRILDLPLQVAVRLGATRLPIQDILQLGQGSIVELQKLAGEPLEVFINGVLMARGEAVVVNDRLGVRVTEILAPAERAKALR